MKYASVNFKVLENELSNHLIRAVDPTQGAKYAMMLMCPNSDALLKLAKMDPKLATGAAIELLRAKFASIRTDDIPDADIPKHTKEAVNKIVEFRGVDKVLLKRADRALAQAFPTFYGNEDGKLAYLLYVTKPEVMKKTAYYNASPSALMRFGLPIAATAAITGGTMGAMALANKVTNEVNRMTAYNKLIAVDPELGEYPPDKVQKIIDDTFAVAPSLMSNDTIAANIVHQLVAAPPAGVSVDFADKLIKADKNLAGDPGDRAIRIFGPASSLITKALDIF